MTVTATQLALRIGADDGPDVTSALGVAEALVAETLSEAYRPVPEVVRDQLVLEVGHAVYKRSETPSGSAPSVDFGSGYPVQGPKDPFAQVWPIIRRYVLPL